MRDRREQRAAQLLRLHAECGVARLVGEPQPRDRHARLPGDRLEQPARLEIDAAARALDLHRDDARRALPHPQRYGEQARRRKRLGAAPRGPAVLVCPPRDGHLVLGERLQAGGRRQHAVVGGHQHDRRRGERVLDVRGDRGGDVGDIARGGGVDS